MDKRTKTLLLVLIPVAVLVVAAIIILVLNRRGVINFPFPKDEISTFEECIEAGNPVKESYPRQCTTEDGETFIEEIEDETSTDTGLANPASEYCEAQGGSLQIEENEDGETGYCVFDDGSKCEEWAFYRGECEKGEQR